MPLENSWSTVIGSGSAGGVEVSWVEPSEAAGAPEASGICSPSEMVQADRETASARDSKSARDFFIVNFLTAGGQTVAIIVTEQTFEDAFDRMGIHRRVLSRTLEDAGTLSAPIVPWGVATLYVMEVLGCGTEYIPYCWFIFIVPIFSILCAFSGFGIWDKDGNKMWGRKKAAAK